MRARGDKRRRDPITERRLRAVARIREHWRQLADSRHLLALPVRARSLSARIKSKEGYPVQVEEGREEAGRRRTRRKDR